MAVAPRKDGRAKSRRGHPERDPIEIYRTRLWARAVYLSARAARHKLERTLGKDGRWIGLWARYDKGLVSPSRERIHRIGKKLPGTSRYYFCPVWGLLQHRFFTQDELRTAVDWLGSPFRVAFLAGDDSSNGPFWRKPGDRLELLDELIQLLGDREKGLDALVAILVVLREAELSQDAKLYLFAMRAWAQVENRKIDHPILRYFPTDLIVSVLEPLDTIQFAYSKANEVWAMHVATHGSANRHTIYINTAAERIDLVCTFPMINVNF